jgi:cell wall-associated NlpC family hydrolase
MTDTITSSDVTSMMDFMVKQIGKGYSEAANLRLGPTDYDCSGLVYEAAKQAGINIPQGDDIANLEANYLGALPGVKVIKNASDVKTGDVMFFTGASPGPSNYGGIGHTGVATSSNTFVSALDTQQGVTEAPFGSGAGFVVAMRLNGADISSPSGSGGGSQGGISSDVLNWLSGGLWDKLSDLLKIFHTLTQPSIWLRMATFLFGIILLMFAIWALIRTNGGKPLTPQQIPVPIPV